MARLWMAMSTLVFVTLRTMVSPVGAGVGFGNRLVSRGVMTAAVVDVLVKAMSPATCGDLSQALVVTETALLVVVRLRVHRTAWYGAFVPM